jgi:hypothetical protein
MKSFGTFLTESKASWSTADFTNTLESSRHVEAFDQRGAEWMRDKGIPRLIEQLNNYVTGDVPNPVFKDIKDLANRVLEIALNYPSHIYAIIRANKFGIDDGITDGLPYSNTIPGRLKRAAAGLKKNASNELTPYFQWAVTILTELEPVSQAVESLKSRAVKKQPKPIEDRTEKYIAPMAKRETGKIILDALRKMTDAMKDDYAKAYTVMLIRDVEEYASFDRNEQHKQYRHSGRNVRDAWDVSGNVWVLKPNYKAACKVEGDDAAKRMQEEFIFKNAKKLASIAETKGIGLVNEPKPKNLRIGAGTYEGELDFLFSDGSKFTVRNKVTVSRSKYGLWFNQFPTTFHDVVLPGGAKMPMPSEERMNTVFAVTK